jgi:hypothetical protein
MLSFSRFAVVAGLPCFVAACSGVSSSANADGNGSASRGVQSSRAFTCAKDNSPYFTFIELKGSSITLTDESYGGAEGTPLRSDSNATVYGNFVSDVGIFTTTELTVPSSLVASGSGAVVQLEKTTATSEAWNCHTATSAELNRDHCMPTVKDIDPVDAPGEPQIDMQADGYRVTIHDGRAGDFVYFASRVLRGLACEVTKVDPVSCSAVVADAIGDAADVDTRADDGGPLVSAPHVRKVSDTEYEGGVHVDEWGEDLAYVVKTNGSADHCTVTSVEAETTK